MGPRVDQDTSYGGGRPFLTIVKGWDGTEFCAHKVTAPSLLFHYDLGCASRAVICYWFPVIPGFSENRLVFCCLKTYRCTEQTGRLRSQGQTSWNSLVPIITTSQIRFDNDIKNVFIDLLKDLTGTTELSRGRVIFTAACGWLHPLGSLHHSSLGSG